MSQIRIQTNKAPKATGPYSQAILERYIFRLELSGQIGIDPKTSKLVEGFHAQTRYTLDNIVGVLSEIGWGFRNITKMSDYEALNEIYAETFDDNPPARTVVAVSELPLGALVEIECTAGGNFVSSAAMKKYKIA